MYYRAYRGRSLSTFVYLVPRIVTLGRLLPLVNISCSINVCEFAYIKIKIKIRKSFYEISKCSREKSKMESTSTLEHIWNIINDIWIFNIYFDIFICTISIKKNDIGNQKAHLFQTLVMSSLLIWFIWSKLIIHSYDIETFNLIHIFPGVNKPYAHTFALWWVVSSIIK